MINKENFKSRLLAHKIRFLENSSAINSSALMIIDCIEATKDNEGLRESCNKLISVLNKRNIDIRQHYAGMFLINVVSYLECFLVDVLKEIILLYPKKLSSKKITVKELIEHSEEELIMKLSEAHLNELTYKSPQEYLIEFGKLASIDIGKIQNDWVIYMEAKARRDLGVHNDWKINDIYREKSKQSPLAVSDGFAFPGLNYLIKVMDSCNAISNNIYEQIIQKYT